MIDESLQKLLRFMIDFDGDMPLTPALQIISNGVVVPRFFDGYNSKDNEYFATGYTYLYETAAAYLTEFNCLITDSIMSDVIQGERAVDAKVKHGYMDCLKKLRRIEVDEAEFKFVLARAISAVQKIKLLDISQQALERSRENPQEAIRFLNMATADIITRTDVSSKPSEQAHTLASFMRYHLKEFETTGKLSSPTAKFGFPSLDLMSGGLFGDEITGIAGAQNSGKSFIVQEIVIQNVLDGIPVVWCFLENGDHQMKVRILSHQTGISIIKLNNDVLLSKAERKRVRNVMRVLSERDDDNLLLLPAKKSRTALAIRNEIYQWGKTPGLVGVDYINWMESSSYRGGEDHLRIKNITKELKQFVAQEFHTHVLTPVQLSRAGAKSKKKEILDLQYHSLNMDLDSIFIIEHDEERMYVKPPEGEFYADPGEIFLTCGRGRNIPQGHVIKLEVNFSVSAISETKLRPRYDPTDNDDKVNDFDALGDDHYQEWVNPVD